MAKQSFLDSLGGIGGVLGGVAGIIPTALKIGTGISQLNKANNMNPQDPGYTLNNGVIDNARILADRYSNYQMPGYGQAVNNINSANSQAFSQGVQGASSGGDVLDLASKLAYGQTQQLNQLANRNAQGADNALLMSLNANAQSGQEYQNKNAYDRDIFQQQLREKAALTQAGNQNIYGGVDQGASVIGSYLNPRASVTNPNTATPEQQSQWLEWARKNNINING